MKKETPIKLFGRIWRVKKQTETKLVLVPAENPLEAWRQARGLTQRAAAEQLGISQGQLARIETGTRIPSPSLLAKLR